MDNIERLNNMRDIIEKEHLTKKLALEKMWDNLPQFLKPNDVPTLPVIKDKTIWETFYVPRLIKAGAIPKKDLIDGQYYIGNHRRAIVAKWHVKKNKFIYNREKFGNTFKDTCNHFEDDDGYALFVPIKIATKEEYIQNKII